MSTLVGAEAHRPARTSSTVLKEAPAPARQRPSASGRTWSPRRAAGIAVGEQDHHRRRSAYLGSVRLRLRGVSRPRSIPCWVGTSVEHWANALNGGAAAAQAMGWAAPNRADRVPLHFYSDQYGSKPAISAAGIRRGTWMRAATTGWCSGLIRRLRPAPALTPPRWSRPVSSSRSRWPTVACWPV